MLMYVIVLFLYPIAGFADTLSLAQCVKLASKHHPEIKRAHKTWELHLIHHHESMRKWSPSLSPLNLDIPFSNSQKNTSSLSFNWKNPAETSVNFSPSLSFYRKTTNSVDNYDLDNTNLTTHSIWQQHDVKFYSQLRVEHLLFGANYAPLEVIKLGNDHRHAAISHYDSIKSALFDTIQTFRELSITLHQEQQLQKAHTQAKQQLDHYTLEVNAGKTAKSVLIEQQATILRSELNLISLKASKRKHTQKLKQKIGYASDQTLRIDSPSPRIIKGPHDTDHHIHNALIHDNGLMQSHAQYHQLKRSIDIRKLSFYPTLSFIAVVDTPYNAGKDAYDVKYHAGIKMQVPLDHQSKSSKYAAEQIQLSIAKSDFIRKCVDKAIEIGDSVDEMALRYQSIQLMDQRNALSLKNYENAKLKHKNGMISTYELIQQHDQYQQSIQQTIAEKILHLNRLDKFNMQSHQRIPLIDDYTGPHIDYFFKTNQLYNKNSPADFCHLLLQSPICEHPRNTL